LYTRALYKVVHADSEFAFAKTVDGKVINFSKAAGINSTFKITRASESKQ
jgi:hypothetical protein